MNYSPKIDLNISIFLDVFRVKVHKGGSNAVNQNPF